MKNKILEKQLDFNMSDETLFSNEYELLYTKGVSLPVLAIAQTCDDFTCYLNSISSDIDYLIDNKLRFDIIPIENFKDYIKDLYIDIVKDEEDIVRCYDVLAHLLNSIAGRFIPVVLEGDYEELKKSFKDEEFGEDLELSWESYLEVHSDSFYSDYDSEFLVVSIEECFEYASDCY